MKKVVIGAFILLFCLVAAGIYYVPDYYDPSPERIAVINMVVCWAALRSPIEESILSGRPVSGSVADECNWIESDVRVSSRGNIAASHSEYGIEIEFIPSVVGAEVAWRCRGTPAKYAGVMCRESTQQVKGPGLYSRPSLER